ncbi:hypothetical protein [Nocardia xishanensis]|uniref:hypothetical protein n=1 Tax=Nocardia xishanensis TaxID=238964 RepID=UPI00082C74FB|nr:hypothetical protein [Nocardia xishanensis]
MSGDPVEEGSQVVRQGFVQALQTAHTTAALMRGRGGESRSKAEHVQRMNDAAAKEQRSSLEHWIRVRDAIESSSQARELNSARVQEVRARIWRGGQLHELDMRHKERQIERADEDLDRRNAAGRLERKQKKELHKHQVDGYVNREARAVEMHNLEVEYKQLLIDIRRRAAGFADSLTEHGDAGAAMGSAAAFANAQTAEGLSDKHQQAAAAYRARLAEDAGMDVDDFEALADLAAAWEQAGPWQGALDDVAGLTEQLSFATQLEHDTGDVVVDAEVLDAGARDGSLIETAIETAGLTGVDYDAVIDVDIELDPVEIPLGPVPETGVER